MFTHLDDHDLLAEIAVTTADRDRHDARARAGHYDSKDSARLAHVASQRLAGLHIERQARGLDSDAAA